MSKATIQDIIVIMDKSGSMHSMGDEPLQALNGFIQEQRKAIKDDATFSLWTFNDKVQLVIDDQPLQLVKEINEYEPEGMTAMNDAIGKAIITKYRKFKSNNVVCLIITDGKENCSREYTSSSIRCLIKEAEEKKNWKFIFLGANQDVFKEGTKIGFNTKRCAEYMPTCPGALAQLSRDVSGTVTRYRSCTQTSSTPQKVELTLELDESSTTSSSEDQVLPDPLPLLGPTPSFCDTK